MILDNCEVNVLFQNKCFISLKPESVEAKVV